jgi:predicted metal-dependent hydrolase
MRKRDLLQEGIIFFNEGRYYEAHEVWEDLWRETEGPLREFYQGLIHAAVGLHHLKKNNWTGASSQIQKSIRRLSGFTGDNPPVDSAALIGQLSEVLSGRRPPAICIVRSN